MNRRDLIVLTAARDLAASGDAERIRRAAGLSLLEVAKACGISYVTVRRWETAQSRPHGKPALRWYELMTALDRRPDRAQA